MDIRKEFSTDSDKEIQGVWIDVGDGVEMLVARQGNQRYREALQRALTPYTRRGRVVASNEKIAEIVKEVSSEFILLSWRGTFFETDDDGKERDLVYSKEEAYRLFTDYPEFFEMILSISNDVQNFRDETIEANLGNLSNT